MFNKNNYFKCTKVTFISCIRPNRAPDYISRNRFGNISSEYWYSRKGVIRSSRHWSFIFGSINNTPGCIETVRVSRCFWKLNNSKGIDFGFSQACGFAKWTSFRYNTRISSNSL